MIEERIGAILSHTRASHPALVVGVHADGETGVWSRGAEPDAVFEIGSITKTFTATVLASMVRDGLVALDDPVADHLPVAPPMQGRPITLEDLATHRSGFPRLPAGMLVQGYTTQRHNPYASLDDARMRRAIAETRPKRAPGGKVRYSNYGYGLLGYALARRAGMSYAELVHTRITKPLGLAHTALDTPGLIAGHGFFGRPRTRGTSPRSPGPVACARPLATSSPISPSTPGTARSSRPRATPASSAPARTRSASAWAG